MKENVMNFGERKNEFSPKHGKELPVWQSPKYEESKAKAIEIIKSGKYGVQESDFWILMNVTKSEKMAYTGLIISHNGCLKINDCLDSKFDPACVSIDKEGYKGSLVYTYCNPAQGIYEVGEVNPSNCKNEYPYAMAYKRLFDRVVLKLSKLAYAGIYSDSEADEFAQRLDGGEPEKAPKQNTTKQNPPKQEAPKQEAPAEPCLCAKCKSEIMDGVKRDGESWAAKDIAVYTKLKYGMPLCSDCATKAAKKAAKAG